MKIKTVAVLGAGAVGSYVIWGLSGRKDIRLGVIAEGERAKHGSFDRGFKIWCPTGGDGLRQELEAIAAAKGIDISKADDSSSHGSAVPPSARYSTLQDLDAGRHTEIDMFSGALVRMGRELGIPTPYNEYTYHIIKALEEKNDGKFDYSKDKGQMTCAK